MSKCYSRYNDSTYLQTCLKPKGHDDLHEGENSSQWTDEQGWWDIYGDSPERARATDDERREALLDADDSDGGSGVLLCLQPDTADVQADDDL